MKLKQSFTGVILTAKLLFSEGNEPLVTGEGGRGDKNSVEGGGFFWHGGMS